jgi:hypothetical protein
MSKLIALIAIAVAIACSSSDTTPGTDPAASHHAPEGVQPGSHEDWCGEHAVPESQCSRCNPSLIPAFQASGDWCGEHALPESQCLACNPNLRIERPAKRATN